MNEKICQDRGWELHFRQTVKNPLKVHYRIGVENLIHTDLLLNFSRVHAQSTECKKNDDLLFEPTQFRITKKCEQSLFLLTISDDKGSEHPLRWPDHFFLNFSVDYI